jgi:hypothetical protein
VAIAPPLRGGGDTAPAAHYAERAAEQAVAKLAFAQAARLFQLTCDTISPSSPDARRLLRRVAETSEWAGYAEKAARAYLAAGVGAPTLERVDLERAAASQLIAAGRIDESAEVCRRVLIAVGRKAPDSVLGMIFWIIVYRITSSFLVRSKFDGSTELSIEERVRLDALHAIGRGTSLVDPILAAYVKARYLVDALRAGNRAHVIRAATSEASTLASRGGIEGKKERALFDITRRLCEQGGDDEGYALYQIMYGVCEYLRGHWRSSVQQLDEACARLAAARRWQANANVFGVFALVYAGDLREVKARTTRLVADAERRGDLYTLVNLRASHPIAALVAADNVDGARRHIVESIAQWSKTRFLVQHWQAMLWEAEIDLYAADGARAWTRLERDARSLRHSHLFSVQLMRVLTQFVSARSAIASLDGLAAAHRVARLKEARRLHRLLEREGMPWIDPLAAMVAASLANAEGDAPAAARALGRAVDLASSAEMSLHAEAARHRLGLLLGGDRGRAMVNQAEEAMRSRGVRVPERYARMLVPGVWPTLTTPGA